jgi:hypothetical protein
MNGIGVILLKTESLLHIIILDDDFISLRKRDGLKKFRKILINLNILRTQGKSKTHHQFRSEEREDYQDEMNKCKNG